MPPSDLGDLPTVLLNEHAARHLHRFPDGTLRASVTGRQVAAHSVS